MSTMSDILGASAASVVFEHAGKSYQVTPVTQQVKSAIERWLRKLAYADLYEQRQDMPADQYQDALAALQRDRGNYAYLGDAFWRTVGTPEGSVGLVSVLFQTDENGARILVEERGADVQALVQETILASMPRERAEAARKRMQERKKADGGQPANPPVPA